MDYVVSCFSQVVFWLKSQVRVLEEPECCDGSDEPLGICPNVCEQVGKAYAQKMEAELKLRKTVGASQSNVLILI